MKRILQKFLIFPILAIILFNNFVRGQNVAEQPDKSAETANQNTLLEEVKAPSKLENLGKTETAKDKFLDLKTSQINLQRVDVQTVQSLPLTLKEVVQLALDNNNDIRAAETDVRIAEFNLRSARGVFDPVFQTENFFERSVTPTSSTIQGGADGKIKQTNFANNFGLRGLVPRFGGSYEGSFNNSRQTTNQLFNSLNPQYPTSFSFTFTQPLLRGRKTDDNRRRIEVAKRNVSLSDAQFRQRTIETVEQVETAYWNLTFALKNLQVQRDAVRQAEAQLESNRRQVEQGVLAPIDVVQAETQVANFKQNLFAAQEQVSTAENELKRIILPQRTHPFWEQPIIPASQVALDVPRISLPEAVKSAFDNRPEIAQSEANREINQINTRFLRDQTKPRVDLVATYRTDGLAGTVIDNGDASGLLGSDPQLRERVNELSSRANLPPLPPLPTTNLNAVPENLAGGYGRSLSNLFSQNYPTFRVGVRVELPIGNRAAKADLGRSLAEGTRLDYERRQTEQNIEAEVRTALQSVASAEARFKAATEARVAAEKQYAGEQRQLLNGTSTVFLVLERQTALVGAQGREIEAQTNLNRTIGRLRRVTGGTLENAGITLRFDKDSQKSLVPVGGNGN